MLRFEPANMQDFTRRLLAEASRTIWLSAVVGGIVGALGGDIWLTRMLERLGGSTHTAGMEAAAVVTGLLIGAAIGFAIGTQRALTLRFTAYMALCQLEIERNTRASRIAAASGVTAAPPPDAGKAAAAAQRPTLPMKR